MFAINLFTINTNSHNYLRLNIQVATELLFFLAHETKSNPESKANGLLENVSIYGKFNFITDIKELMIIKVRKYNIVGIRT